MEGPAFSSVHMRERDKAVEERHKKAIEFLQGQLNRSKRANDETRKDLFEARNKNNRLVESLGFDDISEAQQAIDTTDDQMSFKDRLQYCDSVSQQLREQRDTCDRLMDQVYEISRERDHLQDTVAALRDR